MKLWNIRWPRIRAWGAEKLLYAALREAVARLLGRKTIETSIRASAVMAG